MKYTAQIHKDEPEGHGFLACLTEMPQLPKGEYLASESAPYQVAMLDRNPLTQDFSWCVFDGAVKDWKDPIGQALLDAGAQPKEWKWMTLHED